MNDDSSPPDMGLRDVVGLGSLLIATVVAGTGLGLVADDVLSTNPAFTLVGLAVGIASGVVGSWMRVRRFLG